MPTFLPSVFVGFLSTAAATAPSCKSATGVDVDFAYSFKHPDSWNYAYMDSNNELAPQSNTLDTDDSSITSTLLQIHDDDVSFVLWNDQPPPHKDSSSPMAHAKGVLAFSSTGGFWLTHSLPHFPSTDAKSGQGFWRDASDEEGQAFLCITLDAAEIHKLSPVMKINRPVVYDTKFATGGTTEFPDVVEWAQDKKWDEETMTAEVGIHSKGGQLFHYFGKSGNWGGGNGKDLYRDLVAPEIGGLYMEGWRRGSGVWGPACGEPKVYDVLEVKFPGMDWTTTKDHSKWAVSLKLDYFCVGDINRADGQDARGGGTVCIYDASFAHQIQTVIVNTDKDKCPSTNLIV